MSRSQASGVGLFKRFGLNLTADDHARIIADPYTDSVGKPRYMGAEQAKRGIRYVMTDGKGNRTNGGGRVTEPASESVTVTAKSVTEAPSVTESVTEKSGPLTPAEKQRRYRERKKQRGE